MKLLNQRVIYRGVPGTRTANCCFPAIARLLDGSYLVSWRNGSRKDSTDGEVMLSRSTDEGQTWSAATKLPLGSYAEMQGEGHYGPVSVLGHNHLLAAVMWVDRSSPELPFFHPRTEGLLPVRTVLCESRDSGQTWNDYREMDSSPYYSPMPITGPVMQLNDGRLACQFEVNKNYEETQPWRHAAAWKVSSDGGHTWPDCIEIANDPTGRLMYWDAHYAIGTDGYCVAAYWTYDREKQKDVHIHLGSSSDGGRTWSSPRDTGITGQVCHPLLLDNGQMLLIYVDRYESRSIRAILSDDLGHSFHSDTVIYQHPNPVPEAGQASNSRDYLQDMDVWTFGRVDAVARPDGVTSVVFYAGNPAATSIYWAQLAMQSMVRKSNESTVVGRPHIDSRSPQVKTMSNKP